MLAAGDIVARKFQIERVIGRGFVQQYDEPDRSGVVDDQPAVCAAKCNEETARRTKVS